MSQGIDQHEGLNPGVSRASTRLNHLEGELEGLWRGILEGLPLEYLIDELTRRGKVLSDDQCPYCEKDFEVPPELLLIEIMEVKKGGGYD